MCFIRFPVLSFTQLFWIPLVSSYQTLVQFHVMYVPFSFPPQSSAFIYTLFWSYFYFYAYLYLDPFIYMYVPNINYIWEGICTFFLSSLIVISVSFYFPINFISSQLNKIPSVYKYHILLSAILLVNKYDCFISMLF